MIYDTNPYNSHRLTDRIPNSELWISGTGFNLEIHMFQIYKMIDKFQEKKNEF